MEKNIILYDEKEQAFKGLLNGKPFRIEDKGDFLQILDESGIRVMSIEEFLSFLRGIDFFYTAAKRGG